MAGPARLADIAKTIGLGTTRTNDLLREMVHVEILSHVARQGLESIGWQKNKAKNKLMGQ